MELEVQALATVEQAPVAPVSAGAAAGSRRGRAASTGALSVLELTKEKVLALVAPGRGRWPA
ncbi:MAG: hypothetical protein KIT58_02140 [Planctomycetota bacterium]|nr:hypothetical protein [Planctomycetota bacterium]